MEETKHAVEPQQPAGEKFCCVTGVFSLLAMLRVGGGHGLCILSRCSGLSTVAAGLVLKLRREFAGCVSCFWT